MTINERIRAFVKLGLTKTLGTYDLHKYWANQKRSFERRLYKTKYSTEELLEFIQSFEILPGDTVFLTTTSAEFYNHTGKITDIINALVTYLGPEGNLVMPSNTDMYTDGSHFDSKRTPTNAGLIAEVFRRIPGVKRSTHLNSSVCALGKDAEEIVKNHHLSVTSWDRNSPHHRLYKMGAKILSLGNGYFFTMGTPFHCIDSTLHKELPYFSLIFQNKISYSWKDSDGNEGRTEIYRRIGKMNLRRYNKYLRSVPHINGKLSNLKGYCVSIRALVDRGIDLGRKGIVVYTNPKPHPHLFIAEASHEQH